jgi:hypothetical protein
MMDIPVEIVVTGRPAPAADHRVRPGMNTVPAFELGDLTVLLGLDLAEPSDQSDIEAIEAVLERRRAADSSMSPDRRERPQRAPLYLVP